MLFVFGQGGSKAAASPARGGAKRKRSDSPDHGETKQQPGQSAGGLSFQTERCGWDRVGGLEQHIQALKECVILPLVYPEVNPWDSTSQLAHVALSSSASLVRQLFTHLRIQPPRGVLLHG